MAYGYDLESAKAKLPPAIEETETFINSRCPAVKDTIMEVAKFVNADKLTKIAEQACNTVDSVAQSFKGLCGSDGDSVTTATLHGALAAVKKMDEAMNGAL